ncbi:MAG: outer membrane lipoprotein-sorting protein [SAR324 cluster bacterium]|nr:outer membrane lipoprotein-sorting protein [SAR324 cluster bacterium]
MKKILLFACGMFVVMGALHAADMTAQEIMVKVDKRDTGETSISESAMILIDKNGNQRVRQTKMFRRQYPDVKKSISFFLTPADVKDTSFLSYDWEDDAKEDDSWLYLPALRKVKRIAASDKAGSFMGSDFTYSDIEGINIKHYDYAFVKESEMIDGADTWVIESTPKPEFNEKVLDETGYIKQQVWVRKDNFMVVRGMFWVKKGKKIKYLTISDIEKIDNIWTGKTLQMVTTQNGVKTHATVLKNQGISYNKPVEEDMFSTQRMERGL